MRTESSVLCRRVLGGGGCVAGTELRGGHQAPQDPPFAATCQEPGNSPAERLSKRNGEIISSPATWEVNAQNCCHLVGDVSVSLCKNSQKHLWEQNIPKSCISQVLQHHLKEQKKPSESCLFCERHGLVPRRAGSDEYREILIYRSLGRDSPGLGWGRRQRCDGTIRRETGWPAWSFAWQNCHCCTRERWGLLSSLPRWYQDLGWPQASGCLAPDTVFLLSCQVCGPQILLAHN